jgi:hypothetical protein
MHVHRSVGQSVSQDSFPSHGGAIQSPDWRYRCAGSDLELVKSPPGLIASAPNMGQGTEFPFGVVISLVAGLLDLLHRAKKWSVY